MGKKKKMMKRKMQEKRRERKKEKDVAAAQVQKLYRGTAQRSLAERQSQAAVMLQAQARRKIAHASTCARREELAKAHGVLVACPGTIQGHSGWYHQTAGGDKYYFTVDDADNWALVSGPVPTAAWKDFVEKCKASDQLMPLPGTDKGQDGFYMNSKQQVVHVQHRDR